MICEKGGKQQAKEPTCDREYSTVGPPAVSCVSVNHIRSSTSWTQSWKTIQRILGRWITSKLSERPLKSAELITERGKILNPEYSIDRDQPTSRASPLRINDLLSTVYRIECQLSVRLSRNDKHMIYYSRIHLSRYQFLKPNVPGERAAVCLEL